MMFLFAGHSDKPLKSLISMAHKGNHICLHRFSFIYVIDDLWEDAYICPIYAMNCTTESANCVMELTVMGGVPILGSVVRNMDWRFFALWIDGFSLTQFQDYFILSLHQSRRQITVTIMKNSYSWSFLQRFCLQIQNLTYSYGYDLKIQCRFGRRFHFDE